MKAKDFDKKFDDGAVDIVQDLDLTTARRLDQRQRRVPVDLPIWMVASLDKEAPRLGATPCRGPRGSGAGVAAKGAVQPPAGRCAARLLSARRVPLTAAPLATGRPT